jgi:hypothetical protein
MTAAALKRQWPPFCLVIDVAVVIIIAGVQFHH